MQTQTQIRNQWVKASTVLLLSLVVSTPRSAEALPAPIPVLDTANLIPNTSTAVFQGLVTVQQGAELVHVIKQLTIARKNARRAGHWKELFGKLKEIQRQASVFRKWKEQSGSIEAHLSHFKTQAQMMKEKCFQNKDCSEEDQAQIRENDRLVAVAEMLAAKASVETSFQAQSELKKEEQKLRETQDASRSASGRMAAMDFANQLSGAQNEQLLKMRAQLAELQALVATRAQGKAHRRAREQAHAKAARTAKVKKSRPASW